MLKRILVPLDGSKLSETAIPCALDLASRYKAETMLVEVTRHLALAAPGLPPETALAMQAEQLKHSRNYLEQHSAAFAPQEVTICTPLGRPADEISRLALEKGCDLIVMCSHGRDYLSRWLLGSVAEGVIRQAHCPVLLLRPPMLDRSQFRNILVPSDGSQPSLAFLADLHQFLAPEGKITLLLSTGTSLSPELGAIEGYFERIEKELRRVEYNGATLPVAVLKGEPASDILGWCENQSCDLIAMSTHGRGGYRRFWLGSITEKVARHASCPVLVFPHFQPLEEEY